MDKVVQECEDEGKLQIRVGFVGYRDHKDTERFTILPFTEDLEAVKAHINKTHAEGGGDMPEDVVGGLKMCLNQDWTEEATKKVFLICDAPPHGR